MLVWVKNKLITGTIANEGKDFLFAYDRGVDPASAISITMPISVESYRFEGELHPIFQMNMPEGVFRASALAMFRKAHPNFNDLDLLDIMGQSQIGRLRYSESSPLEEVQSQSVEEILRYNGTEDLMAALLEKFALSSGISGAQPKVLIKDASPTPNHLTVRGATHIVKTFVEGDFPQLAANEYFCMLAAKRAGLRTAKNQLSDNGKFLVVDRFDITPEGEYLGFEDFCVLNGLGTSHKYSTSYEQLAKRIKDFVSEPHRRESLSTYFKSLVTACAIRNGDHHLKNLGVLYKDAESPVTLAPTYDMVCTTPYLKGDTMALTLDGTKRFTNAKRLINFAKLQCGMTELEARQAMDQVAQAISETRKEVNQYMTDHPEFVDIGTKMLHYWDEGLNKSLNIDPPQTKAVKQIDGPEPV